MIRRALLGIAVLAATVPVSAPAAAAPNTLTIVGSTSSYVTVTVRRETMYDLGRATVEFTGGRWGGFVVGSRDTPTLRTVYDAVPRWRLFQGRAFRGVPGQPEVGILRPGTHRIYLFTDGQPVTVVLPWEGPTRTLRPTTPVDTAVAFHRVPVDGTASAVAALPQTGGPRSVTYGAAHLDAVVDHSESFTLLTCFARVPGSWDTCDRRFGGIMFGPGASALNGFGLYRRAQGATAGLSYAAGVDATTVGVLTIGSIRFEP